jgi:uncharacterized protein YbaP (TraB family)
VILSAVLLLAPSISPQAFAATSVPETSDGTTTDARTAPYVNTLYPEIERLIREHYPKAKFTKTDRKIHFEYKARLTTVPGNRQEVVPDFGGVIGDIELRDGPYTGKVRLPQQFNEHAFYSVILMAPFSEKRNLHFYTRLEYPSDTPNNFLDEFRDKINSLDDVLNSGKFAEPAAVSSVPSGTAASSPPAGSETSAPAPPVETTIRAAAGSAPAGSGTAPVEAEKRAPTFLWKVTKDGDTIYLLGTIHGAISQFYPLPSAIDQAFDESKQLMVEIAIDKVEPEKIAKIVHQLGQYTPPDHLSKHLTPETKKIFEQYLSWSGETWEMYEKFKPFYVAGLAQQSQKWATTTKFRSGLGLDLYFLARAREAGKVISDLETVEQQLHIDADLSEDAQDRLLRTSIIHMKQGDGEAQINGYLAAWKAGDTAAMEELAYRRTRDYPELREYEKALLDNRNVGMLAKIKQLVRAKPGPHFVAVGAAHLVGKQGLVALFERDGYKVERVSSAVSSPLVASTVANKIYPERFKIWFPAEPKRLTEKDTVRYEVYEPPNGAYLVCVFTSPTEPRDWPVPPPLMLDKLVSIFKPDPGSRKSFTLQGYPGREIESSGSGLNPKFNQGASKEAGGKPGTPANKPTARPASRVPGKTDATPLLPARPLPGNFPAPADEQGTSGASAEKKGALPGHGGFGLGAAFEKVNAKDVKAKIRVYLAGRRFYLLCAVGGKPFLASENVTKFFDSLELLSN